MAARKNIEEPIVDGSVTRLALRELCGYRAGDKGDIANVALFADDDEVYELLLREVTPARVKAHFGSMVTGDVTRYEARNVLGLNFVMQARSAAAARVRCAPTTSARPWVVRSSASRSTCRPRWPVGGARAPTSRGPTRSCAGRNAPSPVDTRRHPDDARLTRGQVSSRVSVPD